MPFAAGLSGLIYPELEFWTIWSKIARMAPMARFKEFDRNEVLQRAIELFAQYGYEGTSTDALLDGMDISRQSLYDTFGSKRALYIEALRSYNRGSAAEFVKNLANADTPLTALRRALLSIVERDDKFTEGACLGVGSICEFGRRDPGVMAAIAETAPLFIDPLISTLSRAKAAGEIRADIDLQLTADFLLTTLNGLKVNARAGMPVERLSQVADVALKSLTVHKAEISRPKRRTTRNRRTAPR
jgi:TetR/AcrR family transcriptional repressor of nem operon